MNALCNIKTAPALLLAAIAMVSSVGCGMPKASDFKPSKLFSLDNSWPFKDDEPEEGIPVRMVGAWTDTVLTKPGQEPQRGFGGRVMFYGKKNQDPILVDGQLVVYAFDETGRSETDNTPTRRYVFPADQMPRHLSKSDVGASYSFWLPWDVAGGPKTEVSLMCRFEPKGGAIITGEQTRHLLPGSMPAASNVANRQPPRLPEGVPSRPVQPTLESIRAAQNMDKGAQLASYETAVDPRMAALATAQTAALPIQPSRQMTVTSISLPKDFQLPDVATAYAQQMNASAPTMAPIMPQQPMMPIQQSVAAPTTQWPAMPGVGAIQMHSANGPTKLVPPVQPHVGTKFESRLAMQPQAAGPQYPRSYNGQSANVSLPGSTVTYPARAPGAFQPPQPQMPQLQQQPSWP